MKSDTSADMLEQTQAHPVNPEAAVTVQSEVKRPDATPYIIFSVVNIVLCGSSVFGIIALVFALLGMNEKNVTEASQQLKISMILNIIGLSLGLIALLFVLVYLIFMFAVMRFAFIFA